MKKTVCTGCGLRIGHSFSCDRQDWKTDTGRRIRPIRWGDETNQWEGEADDGKPCPDCFVAPGMFHHVGCEVEQIPDAIAAPPEPEEKPEPLEAPRLLEMAGSVAHGALWSVGYIMGFVTARPRNIALAFLALYVLAVTCSKAQ